MPGEYINALRFAAKDRAKRFLCAVIHENRIAPDAQTGL
jgi:hypothetical protein